MIKKVKLGDFLLWKGLPAKVLWESKERTIGIEMLDNSLCPHCNGQLSKKRIDVIPESPYFQTCAEPVPTIKD